MPRSSENTTHLGLCCHRRFRLSSRHKTFMRGYSRRVRRVHGWGRGWCTRERCRGCWSESALAFGRRFVIRWPGGATASGRARGARCGIIFGRWRHAQLRGGDHIPDLRRACEILLEFTVFIVHNLGFICNGNVSVSVAKWVHVHTQCLLLAFCGLLLGCLGCLGLRSEASQPSDVLLPPLRVVR